MYYSDFLALEFFCCNLYLSRNIKKNERWSFFSSLYSSLPAALLNLLLGSNYITTIRIIFQQELVFKKQQHMSSKYKICWEENKIINSSCNYHMAFSCWFALLGKKSSCRFMHLFTSGFSSPWWQQVGSRVIW